MSLSSSSSAALLVVVLAVPIAGRAEDKPAAPPAAKHECPIQLQGTKVESVDVPDGAAITFTNPASVDELRRRVRGMAAHHDKHDHAKGKAKSGDKHGGMGHGAKMPAASHAVEDVPNGARVLIKPQDPKQLTALRASVHEHAKHLAAGHCPMMGAGGACECGHDAGAGGATCDCPMHGGKGRGEHDGGHDHHH